MLGWLGNAFFASLYHAVPVLTGRPVTSEALGRWLFGIWNFAVVVPGFVFVAQIRDDGVRAWTFRLVRVHPSQGREAMASERSRPRAPPFIDPRGYARHRPEATLSASSASRAPSR
jgi:hypothetical protein